MTTCSRPRPSVSGASRRATSSKAIERQVDHRPHVEHDPVPLQPSRSGRRLRGVAERVEATDEQVSTSGKPIDVAMLVAHRRDVAHLGDGDQPAVGGPFARPTQSKRWTSPVAGKRADLEVLEPPHLQPAGDHRVQPAELDVLLEPSTDPPRAAPVAVRSIQYGRTPPLSARRNVNTSIPSGGWDGTTADPTDRCGNSTRRNASATSSQPRRSAPEGRAP